MGFTIVLFSILIINSVLCNENVTECTCDRYGSATMQCERKTGACDCKVGIGGYKCDKCARGYIGTAPNCTPCGECFDNWNRILLIQKNQTEVEIERGKNIKKVGATGAYSKEFDEMQDKLDGIEKLLNSTEKIDLNAIDEKSNEIRKKINDIKGSQLKELSDSLANATQDNQLGMINLANLEKKLELLKNKTEELEKNGTLLQEANVQGALNLIGQARDKSLKAIQKAEKSQDSIKYADRQCKAAENIINVTKEAFQNDNVNHENSLKQIKENVDNLTRFMPELNNLVCDRYGDPCDSLCGGAGCGVCGEAVTCENGAKQQAEMALELSSKTEELLKEIEVKANDFIRNVSLVNSTSSKVLAKTAYNNTLDAYLQSNKSLFAIKNITTQINDFLAQNVSSPEDIKKIGEEVLKKNIELDPEEIKELAEKIKQAVELVTNIDPIIAETKDDLKMVKTLKENADNAKFRVQEIKNTTVGVKQAIENSTIEQNNVDKIIKSVSSDLDEVRGIMNQIDEKSKVANAQINDTAIQINNLNKKMDALLLNVTKNEQAAATFEQQSKHIDKEAEETYDKLDNLSTKFNKTKSELDTTYDKVTSSKLKVSDLVNRAAQLTATISKLEDDFNKLKSMPEVNIKILENDIDELINKMSRYNVEIQAKSDHYKTCT